MKIWTLAASVVVAAALSGCGAGFARLGTYGGERADALTEVDGRKYSLFVHPADDTVLIQRGLGAALGQAVAEGATFGAVSMQEPKPVWRRAADWLLNPVGCMTTDVYELERISWEAPFVCPQGVDIRKLVQDNRSTLREGQPLAPQQ